MFIIRVQTAAIVIKFLRMIYYKNVIRVKMLQKIYKENKRLTKENDKKSKE